MGAQPVTLVRLNVNLATDMKAIQGYTGSMPVSVSPTIFPVPKLVSPNFKGVQMTERTAEQVLSNGKHISSGYLPDSTRYMEIWEYEGCVYIIITDPATTIHLIGPRF